MCNEVVLAKVWSHLHTSFVLLWGSGLSWEALLLLESGLDLWLSFVLNTGQVG